MKCGVHGDPSRIVPYMIIGYTDPSISLLGMPPIFTNLVKYPNQDVHNRPLPVYTAWLDGMSHRKGRETNHQLI